ncbi:hypothetical protein [Vibrio sp. WXL210]|uniref:hypothetical protein n=1 Tax=Vibrio sp. WXL210 TaxID=3450709 RepID=UPI003EC6E27B
MRAHEDAAVLCRQANKAFRAHVSKVKRTGGDALKAFTQASSDLRFWDTWDGEHRARMMITEGYHWPIWIDTDWAEQWAVDQLVECVGVFTIEIEGYQFTFEPQPWGGAGYQLKVKMTVRK